MQQDGATGEGAVTQPERLVQPPRRLDGEAVLVDPPALLELTEAQQAKREVGADHAVVGADLRPPAIGGQRLFVTVQRLQNAAKTAIGVDEVRLVLQRALIAVEGAGELSRPLIGGGEIVVQHRFPRREDEAEAIGLNGFGEAPRRALEVAEVILPGGAGGLGRRHSLHQGEGVFDATLRLQRRREGEARRLVFGEVAQGSFDSPVFFDSLVFAKPLHLAADPV